MIDTVKPIFYISDLVLNRLSDADGLGQSNLKLYGNKFFLKHPFGYKNPAVFFNLNTRRLWLEASLPKLLQGHNVFGSNRLEKLCLAVLTLIYEHLGLKFTEEERRIVKEKSIKLNRLDLTCSFRVNSQFEVAEVLEAIRDQLQAERCRWSAYGCSDIESVYHMPNSTRLAEKFYNKHREILKHRIREEVPYREEIQHFTGGLIRYELTLRGRELTRRNSGYASYWTPHEVKKTLNERIQKFKFKGVISEHFEQQKIEGLTKGTQAIHEIWALGVNLRRISACPTITRARSAILVHGQDIFRPLNIGTSTPLNKILSAENAYFYAPRFLTKCGAIYR